MHKDKITNFFSCFFYTITVFVVFFAMLSLAFQSFLVYWQIDSRQKSTILPRELRVGMTEKEVISVLGNPKTICDTNEELIRVFNNGQGFIPAPSELLEADKKVIIYQVDYHFLAGTRAYVYINKNGVVDKVLFAWT